MLLWGADKKYIGGLLVALMLFVGIPIPGTGAWTGTIMALLSTGVFSAINLF